MPIIRLEEDEEAVVLVFSKKAARFLYAFMEDVLVQYDAVKVGQTDKRLAEKIMQELDTKEIDK